MLALLIIAATLSGIVQPRADAPSLSRTDSLISTNSGQITVVEHPGATRSFAPQPDAIREMVREGLTHFTAKTDVKEAWLSLISPRDVVGLKVHSAPGRTSGTRPAVVGAFIETLLQAGVPASNIVIWDRRMVDLRLAGYNELAEKYGVGMAGAMDEGYDSKHAYETALLGKLVYGDLEFGKKGEGIGRKSYVSNLLTHRITKIVNITPLLNHNLAGVSGALYGLAIASVDNTLRFEESQRLTTAIPEIYALPEIADAVALNVVDALICQYQGEERSLLHYSTALNQIWFSADPVAVDLLAIVELEKQKGEDKRKTPGKVIYQNAGLMELGVSDPSRIFIERVQIKP